MEEKKPNPMWQAVSLAWELGYTIAVPLVAFALAGRFLDKKLGSSPLLLLGGILLALVTSTILVYKKIAALSRQMSKEEQKRKSK